MTEPTRADIAARALDAARFLARDPSKVPDQVALEQDYWVVHREPTVALSYAAVCDRVIDMECDPGALLGYVALEMKGIALRDWEPVTDLSDADLDRWLLTYQSLVRVYRMVNLKLPLASASLISTALFNEMTHREMAKRRTG